MSDPLFLSREEVLAFHSQQVLLFGGDPGLGDPGLLESALAQPQNTYLYNAQADLFDIAAAYAFHLSKNHPFSDGNKRTALHTALAFLALNNVHIVALQDDLYAAMMDLVTGKLSKGDFAQFLRTHVAPS